VIITEWECGMLYKKTSRLISSVLTGYPRSNLSLRSTSGCRMPKTPIVWCVPPILILIAAE
jgi:hypothetical protein